jgi:hypothetical protein
MRWCSRSISCSPAATRSLTASYGIRRIFSIHRCPHTESIDSREPARSPHAQGTAREQENSKAGGLIYVTQKNYTFVCVTFLRDLGRGTSGAQRRRSAWSFANSRSDIAWHTADRKYGAASDGQHDSTANRQHARRKRDARIESDQSERTRRQLDDEP